MRRIRQLIVVAVSLGAMVCRSASARTYEEAARLAEVFKAHGVTGAFVLFDPTTETVHMSDEVRAKKRFIPASTFKIANALIGLDTGAVASVDQVLPYGGKPQRLKQWEQDMNLRDAIKVTNVPIFKELARRIGLERMRESVKKLGYGNMEVGDVVDLFWLDGPLEISALEQTEFLHRLVTRDLPVKVAAIDTVKQITIVENTADYTLHAKTGWYWPDDGGQQIGWWVGWIEKDGTAYPFALNVDVNSDADAAKRIPIGRECLQALGKL